MYGVVSQDKLNNDIDIVKFDSREKCVDYIMNEALNTDKKLSENTDDVWVVEEPNGLFMWYLGVKTRLFDSENTPKTLKQLREYINDGNIITIGLDDRNPGSYVVSSLDHINKNIEESNCLPDYLDFYKFKE